jgi:hypothetical protein
VTDAMTTAQAADITRPAMASPRPSCWPLILETALKHLHHRARLSHRKARAQTAFDTLAARQVPRLFLRAPLRLGLAQGSHAAEPIPMCRHPAINTILHCADAGDSVDPQRQTRTERGRKGRVHRRRTGEDCARGIQPPRRFRQPTVGNPKPVSDPRRLERLNPQLSRPIEPNQSIDRARTHPASAVKD